MSDELRREAIRILEDMPPSASTAGQKILARGVLALLDERDRLRDELECALEIVHGEKRAAELNEKLAALREKGALCPWPIRSLRERCESAEAERDKLQRFKDLCQAYLGEEIAELQALLERQASTKTTE